MIDDYESNYSRFELDLLVDAVIESMGWSDVGFRAYYIRGIYVSPEVVEQALNERLEKMAR